MAGTPRIFWDGYGLDEPHSGIFVHARKLADGLFELGRFKATIVGTAEAAALFPEMDRLVLVKGGSIRRAKPIWPLRTGAAIARVAANTPHVVHGLSNFNVPFFTRTPGQRRVLTVHDVVPLIAPTTVSALYAAQMKLILGSALKSADRIICVSRWTEKTLTDRYPECGDRTIVIPNGVPTTNVAGPKGPRDMSRVRLLTIGRFEPYKRLDQLVLILRRLPAHFTATLVTNAAGEAWARKEAADLIASGRFQVRSQLAAEQLVQAYRDADVLVHPSLFEGFCLPAVEALAAGCPVVHRSGSAIDEIVSPSVGIAVGRDATLDHWVQAVEAAAAMMRTSEWPTRVAAHYATLSTWKDAAHAVQTLYTGLA